MYGCDSSNFIVIYFKATLCLSKKRGYLDLIYNIFRLLKEHIKRGFALEKIRNKVESRIQ